MFEDGHGKSLQEMRACTSGSASPLKLLSVFIYARGRVAVQRRPLLAEHCGLAHPSIAVHRQPEAA